MEKSKKESDVPGSKGDLSDSKDLVGKEVQDEKGQETDHFEEGKKTGVHLS